MLREHMSQRDSETAMLASELRRAQVQPTALSRSLAISCSSTQTKNTLGALTGRVVDAKAHVTGLLLGASCRCVPDRVSRSQAQDLGLRVRARHLCAPTTLQACVPQRLIRPKSEHQPPAIVEHQAPETLNPKPCVQALLAAHNIPVSSGGFGAGGAAGLQLSPRGNGNAERCSPFPGAEPGLGTGTCSA